ncbi:MAG: ketoacyl-ACP synthase III [Mariprofundaceae bacterium]|nr:ketoacyl-ACP synthase III [Mariprofundaceae bacterium]
MARITAIASYIPDLFEDNLQKQEKFGVDSDFILNKLGVRQVSRMDGSEEPSDMCVKAFHALPEKLRPAHIDCVVVCTQNPDGGGIPHVSAIVHGKLGLEEDCACFDIALGCSGYVYSLSILQSFMESNGFETGLLFTADPYSKIIDPDDKNTAMLFGDAATVTVLKSGTDSGDGFLLGRFVFQTRGIGRDALHNADGSLFMNGRAVFNFALMNVPPQVDRLLDMSGLDKKDVDLFLFHQGSKFIVDNLQKKMGLMPEQVPVNMEQFGNTVSSSIPLLLEQVFKEKGKQTVVMSGFGLGLSWASCLAVRD